MRDHVRWLGKHWPAMGTIPGTNVPRRVSVMPNAGLPVLVNGRTEFPLGAKPFAEAMEGFLAEDGVWIVGGCCGTKPEHIAELVREVESLGHGGKTSGRKLVVQPPHFVAPAASVTSLYSPQTYRQDTSILIIGERMNASGSRAFKRLLEAEDWDGIVSLAREQVRHDGAHVLDLNVDYAGRDNARDMSEVVRRVVRQVNVPLMLDSTQVATLEAGLKHSGGKCIINSANFEDGEHKFDVMCSLAKKYGAGLVIGSIDEDKEASMARTAERKLAIAARAYERAVNVHGLAPEDLLFDPLVLPISTGMESDRRSGLETVEGVKLLLRPQARRACGPQLRVPPRTAERRAHERDRPLQQDPPEEPHPRRTVGRRDGSRLRPPSRGVRPAPGVRRDVPGFRQRCRGHQESREGPHHRRSSARAHHRR
jgi:5-methyltetrahydrofolate--homocysteine methyltransferase